MSSYSSLLSMGPVHVAGRYVDDGYNDDGDDMVVAASYLSSFDFDVGEEYASLPEAATAAAFHAEQQKQAPAPILGHSPQADADSYSSGKAVSATSSDGLSYQDSTTSKSLTSGGARSKCSKIAFKTRSEVEVLDDGYRWRKYGKKMVKNSPNPRNYYRCSSEECRVKKRVERERDDARFVITTYDGVHNHPAPLPPRGCAGYSLAQMRVDEGSPLSIQGSRCFLDTMKMHAVGAGNGDQQGCTPVPAPRTETQTD